MRFSLFFITLFLLAACSAPSSTHHGKKAPTTLEKKAFSRTLSTRFRGLLHNNNGQPFFQACQSDTRIKIDSNTQLMRIYNTINTGESEPVYLEFSGEINFPHPGLTSAMMRIDHLHHMALTKTSLQCAKPVDSFTFKAKGDSPKWRANMHNNQLFIGSKAGNETYTMNSASIKITQVDHLTGKDKQGQTVSLNITPEDCYLQKNKEYWGYKAHVRTIDGDFSGCAEVGGPPAMPSFVGEYSAYFQGEAVHLSLRADYTLTLEQDNEQAPLVKTGFWKSNRPDQVVVMLMQQSDKHIREEIIFKRDGFSLSANAVNKDNLHTLFDTPLLFNKMSEAYQAPQTKNSSSTRQWDAQRIIPASEVDLEIKAAVLDYFNMHRTDPKHTRFNSVRFDLNGNGLEDAIVMLDWCTQQSCEMLVFAAHHEGFRFSSRISAQAPIMIAKQQHFSWQSLLTQEDSQWVRVDFDGMSYRAGVREDKDAHKPTGVKLFSQGKPTTWFPVK